VVDERRSWRLERRTGPALLVVLSLPFYLNDFASIAVDDWRTWLVIDYVSVKALPLAVIGWMLWRGSLRADELGLVARPWTMMIAVLLVVAVAGTLVDQNGYRLIADLPGYPALGAMPAIASPAWNWIDLTVGLALVAIVEELVFRGVMLEVLRRYTTSTVLIVVVSSLLFGLIHWSGGLHAVVVTSIIGAVFMVGYLAGGSLLPIMLAHFVINFIDFAGVVPKSLFTFA